MYTTTYLNLLEYSDNYTKSIALQYGFDKDSTNSINSARYAAQRKKVRYDFDANAANIFPVTTNNTT